MEFKELGTQNNTIETKRCIEYLQRQLDKALAKIDDLENRSSCSNFCIQGVLESVVDVQAAVKELLTLIPDITEYRLKIDRARKAPCPDSTPGI